MIQMENIYPMPHVLRARLLEGDSIMESVIHKFIHWLVQQLSMLLGGGPGQKTQVIGYMTIWNGVSLPSSSLFSKVSGFHHINIFPLNCPCSMLV